mgnify:FL=1
MGRGNSKFSGSCEDAESLNLSGQNSGCDLNLDEQNSLKERNCAASNLSDESSAAALNLNEQNSASALNLDNSNSKTTPNLNNQNFTAANTVAASNLDSENSATGAAALNFKNKNSMATDAEAASKTMADAVKTEAATSAVGTKTTKVAQNTVATAEATGAETTRNTTAPAKTTSAEAAAKEMPPTEAEAARPQIQELTNFLSEYTAKMLSIGTYTARIERCVRRIADAYDYEASLMIFVRHFIISVMDPADNSIRRTYVKTGAAAQISFDLISELSALSWEIYDEKIPLARARASFAEILASQKKSFAKTLVLLSVANAAFCELFGGDGGAMALVFAATAFGICARYLLSKLKINLKIQYIAVSFAVSFIVSLGARYGLSATPDVAVGSSILFLIPGVWLINSVFDILNENMLVGISRGLNTGLLIICIAIGLFLTLSISNLGLVNV